MTRVRTLEKLNSALTTDPDDVELSRAKTDLKSALAKHFGTHVASTVTTARKNGWNSYMQANSKRKYEEFRSESGTRLHVCADDRYEQNVKFGCASTELSKEWHDLSEDEKEKYSPQGGSLSDCDAITFSNLDRKTNKHKLWRQMQRQVDSLSSFILLTGSAIFLMLIVE